MINIISKSHCSSLASGPKKVVDNLIKGLELIGYPYVVNRSLDACQRLWIHDDLDALKEINRLPEKIKVVIGPNLVVRPPQLPKGLDFSKVVYLHPSQWSIDFWKDFGYDAFNMESWPSGIDTKDYAPVAGDKNFVLIYFKQRKKSELDRITKILQEKKIGYKIIWYGKYKENDYKKLLSQTRYVIWLGRQESQGFALLEALSTNCPVLVCDVSYVGQWQSTPKEMAVFTADENAYTNTTSAFYFDSRCGQKIKVLEDLPVAIENMEKNLSIFHPRDYILENLSLEKQSKEFVLIYQKYFSLTYEAGFKESVLKLGNWKNDSLMGKIKFLFKDFVKIVFNLY
jgi:glycosyltransferase involved in cell wall biosynthesis